MARKIMYVGVMTLLVAGSVFAYVGFAGVPSIPKWFVEYFNKALENNMEVIVQNVVNYISKNYVLLTKEEYNNLLNRINNLEVENKILRDTILALNKKYETFLRAYLIEKMKETGNKYEIIKIKDGKYYACTVIGNKIDCFWVEKA